MILNQKTIIVGKVVGVHGTKGFVKLKSFTEQKYDIFNYFPYYIDNKKIEKIIFHFQKKDNFICNLSNCLDREDAKKYINKHVFIKKSKLPPLNNEEIYQYELLDFEIVNTRGDVFGKIIQFHNFGAGLIIEVNKNEKAFYLPIDKKFIVDVKLDLKQIIMDVPIETILE